MRVERAFAAVIAVLTAAACSQTVIGTAERTHPAASDRDHGFGFVDDRCGLLRDDAIQKSIGADGIVKTFSGAVCQYVLTSETGLVDVVFSWFESGTFDRERDLATQRGSRITDEEVARRPAFVTQRPDNPTACGATAGAGPGVLTWWVQFRRAGGPPCEAAEKLLAATLSAAL